MKKFGIALLSSWIISACAPNPDYDTRTQGEMQAYIAQQPQTSYETVFDESHDDVEAYLRSGITVKTCSDVSNYYHRGENLQAEITQRFLNNPTGPLRNKNLRDLYKETIINGQVTALYIAKTIDCRDQSEQILRSLAMERLTPEQTARLILLK